MLHIDSTLDWGSGADQHFFSTLFNLNAGFDEADSMSINAGRGQKMLYEIRANQNDWIVVGKTRGTFTISSLDGSHHESPLELIPLREGALFVPSIVVLPLPAPHAEGQFPPPQDIHDNLPSSETYQDDIATCVEILDPRSTTTELQYDPTTGKVEYPSLLV